MHVYKESFNQTAITEKYATDKKTGKISKPF